MLEMNEAGIQKLRGHAVKAYPKECCGILLGDKKTGRVQEIYPAGNKAASDRQKLHFVIHPLELYSVENEAEKRNMQVIGFYHSHVDYPAVLSAEDLAFMIPKCMYMIVSVINGVCTDVKCYAKAGYPDEAYEIKIRINC